MCYDHQNSSGSQNLVPTELNYDIVIMISNSIHAIVFTFRLIFSKNLNFLFPVIWVK